MPSEAPGPVAPTMTTLSEISAQISALGSAGGGGTPKRVVRGVIAFADGECEKTATFSPAIDPAKSVVALSPVVRMTTTSGGSDAQIAANLRVAAPSPHWRNAWLFAAGRTACGLPRFGAGYSSGTSLGDATFFGRQAGKRLASSSK